MYEHDPRIDFFDRLADEWDREHERIDETLVRLDRLAPALGVAGGQDLLEVGCGTGQVTGWLVQRVRPGRVTAIDFAPAMLAKARLRGLDADFRCVDVCNGGLAERIYDIVWCKHVFPHFRDQAVGLRRLAGALKPGGRLIVLHMDNWRAINAVHDRCEPVVREDHLPAPQSWAQLLAEAGLLLEDLRDEDDLFLVIARRARG